MLGIPFNHVVVVGVLQTESDVEQWNMRPGITSSELQVAPTKQAERGQCRVAFINQKIQRLPL